MVKHRRRRSPVARVALSAPDDGPPEPKLYISEWMRALRISQKKMADATDISQGYISQLKKPETYEKGVSVRYLFAIADYMQIPVDALRYPPPPPGVRDYILRLDPSVFARLSKSERS